MVNFNCKNKFSRIMIEKDSLIEKKNCVWASKRPFKKLLGPTLEKIKFDWF